ncbi:hypothetical protein KK425_06580 [Clostridioides difficile]|nr:hypothetical protein [Clostridioides difficile]
MKKNILTTMITMIIILMMSMTVMAEPYQEDETSSLKKQSANERNQTNVGTMDGRVQTNAISKGANYDPKYPLKGMLTQLGLNTTGKRDGIYSMEEIQMELSFEQMVNIII